MAKPIFKTILIVVGLAYIANGLNMWFIPQYWYETVPGVSMMGPFNLHFVRDLAMAYAIMGAGLIYGLRNPSIAMFAALWPAAHAVYHICIFFMRSMPMDTIALTNLLLIQVPAWASLWAAYKIVKQAC